jgi:hypothetical protein
VILRHSLFRVAAVIISIQDWRASGSSAEK